MTNALFMHGSLPMDKGRKLKDGFVVKAEIPDGFDAPKDEWS